MKKSTGLLAVVLLCSLPVFAQPAGGGQQRGGGQPSGGGRQQRGGGQPSGGGQRGGADSVEVPPSGAATSRAWADAGSCACHSSGGWRRGSRCATNRGATNSK